MSIPPVSIEIARLAQAHSFQPIGHTGVGSLHLFGGMDYDGAVTVALSHYTDGDGHTETLQPLDGEQ